MPEGEEWFVHAAEPPADKTGALGRIALAGGIRSQVPEMDMNCRTASVAASAKGVSAR